MHNEFAEIYDIFTKHVDYNGWYKFLKNYIDKKGLLIDLGSGTGEFSYRFLEEGYDVIGVDLSEKMIEIAEKKIENKNLKNAKFIKQDIRNFKSDDKADYIICNFDTINYFSNKNDFIKFLENSFDNLKTGGLLIFDIVTEGIFDEIFENDIFLDEEEEYTSIWRYEKLSQKKHFIEIDLFIKQLEDKKDNQYRKYTESHEKYIYEPEWIIDKVLKKGFEIIDTASNPEFGESRMFFILKKVM